MRTAHHPFPSSCSRALAPLALAVSALCALPMLGCGAATPAAQTPASPAPPAPTTGPAASGVSGGAADAFAVEGPLREEWIPLLKPAAADPAKVRLLAPPPGLAPVPPECAGFVGHKPQGPQGKASCADPTSALAALDAALETSSASDRDLALADLEACRGLPPGVARALRAEFAPTECGEAILEPVLKAPPPSTDGFVYAAMLGEAVASRLARTAQNPPTLAPPHDRAHVLEFIKGPMRAWMEQQALAIESVSQAAAELPYYGKGIAAIEAGIAELRLVEVVRSAPIPDEFKKDEELKNAYYGSLDQVLDPRKDRGRDAALVGLRELALVGVIKDARVRRARELLSRLYGGRRIDALDGLLLPALPRPNPTTVEERLAARLPTFFAGLLLDEHAGSRAGTLRQLLEVGVPLPLRAALLRETAPEARALFARARLDLGRTYWRSVDFDQAVALSAGHGGASVNLADPATFNLALALALRGGPDDAADMMRKAPRALAPPHTKALDAIAAEGAKNPLAGPAAFDAALLHQLGAPEGSSAEYWSDVARRFHAASALLPDATLRAAAEDRASAAEAIAKAVADGSVRAPAR